MQIARIDALRDFSPEGLRKINLFETARFFLDLYCLEPGQSQKPHTHAENDKIYLVQEGTGRFQVGDAEALLSMGEAVLAAAGQVHGVFNDGPDRLVVLTFMAPHPRWAPRAAPNLETT